MLLGILFNQIRHSIRDSFNNINQNTIFVDCQEVLYLTNVRFWVNLSIFDMSRNITIMQPERQLNKSHYVFLGEK